MENIPQPSENARTVANVLVAVAGSLVPGGGVLRELLDIHLNDQLKKYQAVLMEALKEKGLVAFDDLTQGQKEFIIPAAYRFYEQVRLGEYEHNLRILGTLLADGLVNEEKADPGIVGRASRRLEMMSLFELKALALKRRAFEIYIVSDQCYGEEPSIENKELSKAFSEIGEDVGLETAQELLHELSTRGFLTIGGRGGIIGGHYYWKNKAYDEILEASLGALNTA